eukprot:gene8712-8893_t
MVGEGRCTPPGTNMGRFDDVGASGQAARPVTPAEAFAYAPGLLPWYVPHGPTDSTLVFESRFESGNLRRAVQVFEYEYDLVLQPDINTKGHTQFFYFAVANTRAGQTYRFNIINLQKQDSLYNMGMLPLMHSEHHLRSKGIGWTRCGSKISYGANNIKRNKRYTYYTLTFTVKFPYSADLVHLAHCHPYTYTDLQNQLYVLLKEPVPAVTVQRTTLATSLAGNTVDMLTITAPADQGRPLSQRQGVVLSARVHPGEANASWMMKGAVEQLLADTGEAAQLRESFVFKVVPMLNPDGVIVGNYRCSLAALDLNRVWQDPDSRLQPVITAFKSMMKDLMQEREVVLFCDMHGHSRKHGIFMYGCERKTRDSVAASSGWPVPGSVGGVPGVPVKQQERILPLMLAINAPDLFSYPSCNFKVQKSKAGTGRVVGFRELGLVNAFTMEASFAGPSGGELAGHHYNTGHLEEMGAVLVRTLLDYWAPAGTSSVAELLAHLDGTCSHAGLAALLDVGPSGDGDEDVCTDSDDESSEDDAHSSAQGKQGSTLATGSDGSQTPEAAAVAAATAALAEAHSQVVDTSHQVVALLSRCIPDSAAAAREDGKAAGSSRLVANAPSVESTAPPAGIGSVIATLSALTNSVCATTVATGVGGLTAAEVTLASIPGLVELLQQLVDRCDELNDASANVEAAAAAASMTAANLQTFGNMKGRRRRLARYGNPEVLRAARARADAGLAAALPELG